MAFGDIIRQQLLDDNRKKVNMMHWCFIKDLMSINIDIDIKKGKKAFDKYTWNYANDMWSLMLTESKRPDLEKMSMYFISL